MSWGSISGWGDTFSTDSSLTGPTFGQTLSSPKAMIDPFSALLFAGNMGIGAFTGMRTADAQYRAADKTARATRYAADQQLNAARYASDSQLMAGRDAAKANLGSAMFAANFASQEKDLDLGRQFKAAMMKAGPLADAFRESRRRDALADFGLRTGADFLEENQRQNKNRLKQSLAERMGAMAGMYGPIAPIDVGAMFK